MPKHVTLTDILDDCDIAERLGGLTRKRGRCIRSAISSLEKMLKVEKHANGPAARALDDLREAYAE